MDYDRKTAARLGISSQLIDNTLYDAFGQRPVSTMYTSLNQYYVVMEVAPKYWQNPDTLNRIYVSLPAGEHVPLGAFARVSRRIWTSLAIAHHWLVPWRGDDFSPSARHGVALGDAENDRLTRCARSVGCPSNIADRTRGNSAGIIGDSCWAGTAVDRVRVPLDAVQPEGWGFLRRKPHSPDYDSFDVAFGGLSGAAGARC